NDGWHDDVSDGPVTATITLPNQPPVQVHQSAWAVVAPPDFAPGVSGIVTLYEVALQAAIDGGMLKADPKPSFRRDIKPVIERALTLRWSNNFNRWNLTLDFGALNDPSGTSLALRTKIGKLLKSPGLRDFVVPAFLSTYIDQWIKGKFVNDLH